MTDRLHSTRTIVPALAAVFVLALSSTTSARTPSPSPNPAPAHADAGAAPAASASPATPKPDRALRVHRGIVICEGAPFYSWPDHNTIPSGSTYPPARMGDSFEVIGDGTLANNGTTLYETTIDVVAPYGFGKHYYIAAGCMNAG